MASPLKPSLKKWVSLSAFVGFALFILYIIFFTNVGQVVVILKGINLAFYAVAFLCVLGSVVFNTLTWQQLLSNVNVKTKFMRVLNLSLVGMFIDAIVPGGWSGDIFKTYLLSKDENVDGARAAAALVLKKVFEFLVTLGALLAGILLLVYKYSVNIVILLLIGAIMVLLTLPLAVIIYLSVDIRAAKKAIKMFSTFFAIFRRKQTGPSSFDLRLQKSLNSLNEFHDGIITIRKNPKSFLQPLGFQIIAWCFDIMTLFLIFVSLGYFVGADKVIITNSIVTNIQTQGFALAGFSQLISSDIYTVLGILPETAVASSLLASLASFWFKTIVSFVAFQRIVLSNQPPHAASLVKTSPPLVEKSKRHKAF